jgi:hypothetical protein
MSNHTRTSSAKLAAPSKPQPQVRPPERRPAPSFPEERAENEGMKAPPDSNADELADTQRGANAKVEGEGSYEGTRRYDDGATRAAARGDTEKLGEEARKALEGPGGDALRRAEKAARQGHTERAGSRR